jgi:hypothetical protein
MTDAPAERRRPEKAACPGTARLLFFDENHPSVDLDEDRFNSSFVGTAFPLREIKKKPLSGPRGFF